VFEVELMSIQPKTAAAPDTGDQPKASEKTPDKPSDNGPDKTSDKVPDKAPDKTPN
jgi:hypothetical protein